MYASRSLLVSLIFLFSCCVTTSLRKLYTGIYDINVTTANIDVKYKHVSDTDIFIFYDYSFQINNYLYTGQDRKKFHMSEFKEAKSFMNTKTLQINYCKNDPLTNGPYDPFYFRCYNRVWVLSAVVFISLLAIKMIMLFEQSLH